MHLYNLTLSRSSGVQCAIHGTFSAPKRQEIVVSRGKVLELLWPDDNGKVQTLASTEMFGVIRCLLPFRLMGAHEDHILVGSDSGRVVVLKFSAEKNAFVKVHQETFGRSGCRRIVPGQYLAADPKGRACMIAAVEKQKFVYVLNRDATGALTISSPLEAHKGHHLTFAVTALDNGLDNPGFAAIELDYSDADQDPSGEAASEAEKHLTFYELDLGTNHVIRKWSEAVDNGANLLITVPGGADGPGGVLLCAENFIIYKNENHEDVRAVIPRREDLPGDRGVLIVSYATHKQRHHSFFFLVQSEYGDIYKVTLDHEDGAQGSRVTELRIKYFDTIPPCVSICVLKSGFLFAASEFGNHGFYQFEGIGDGPEVEASSSTLVETDEGFTPVFFRPRELLNISLADELSSLCPMTDMKVTNLMNEEAPQIYTLCGRGPRSTLRILRPGLAVVPMAVTGLPGAPNAVWTVRQSASDEYDAAIIVSFQNATLVLSIGETIEEVNDSGFLGTINTLMMQLLADDSVLQVHPHGLRHIRKDKRINEWKAPGRRTITQAATNSHQVVIALSGGEIIYFELDAQGMLGETDKKDLAGDVACLAILPVPKGRQRSRFLAVGSFDSTVRILSLDPNECLKVLATQANSNPPVSLLLLDSSDGATAEDTQQGAGGIFLHIGLDNGVMVRNEVDRITGRLSDSRKRFLGTRPPKLHPVTVRGRRAMLALSSRPWLGYLDAGRYVLMPLNYEALDYAAGFSSEQCPEGYVAVAAGSLHVIAIERLGEAFNQAVMRLRYTPRAFVVEERHTKLLIAEADHGAIPADEREDLAAAREEAEMAVDGEEGKKELDPEFEEKQAALDDQFGVPRGAEGQWASCVRVVDPATLATTDLVELDNNEAAISMCLVTFTSRAGEGAMLAVGTVEGLKFCPRESDGGYIRVYKLDAEGQKLELVHKTSVGGVPAALTAFKGRLLAGIGNCVRLYDCGKKKLLRKCEYSQIPAFVVSLNVMGSRIYVGDVQESFHYMKYKSDANQLYIYADDTSPRYITSALQLDYDTMCGADKFGNIFINRLPSEISAEVEDDPTGGKFVSTTGQLNGAPHKLQTIAQFHVGETVTSLQRAVMQPGGQEVIVYGTLMGGVGVLYPFASQQDVDFFSHLEMHIRQENPPLSGRDHLAFRSYYAPVKDVIDGDLCEQYPSLTGELQGSIADDLQRSTGEVLKKLEDVRNRVS